MIHTPLIEDVNFCLQSDIYYFAGIFFVVHSYFKKWKIQTPGLILFSLLGLTLNTLLTPLTNAHITNDIAVSLVGNIVYVNESSCFPLLSWAIFPSTGILLGELLKKADEEKRENIMRRLMDFSLVLFIAFLFSMGAVKDRGNNLPALLAFFIPFAAMSICVFYSGMAG